MRIPVLAAAVLLVALPALPASAAVEPDVVLSSEFHAVPLDHGHLVEIVCGASASSSSPVYVPIATEVTCSLDDVTWRRSTPGRESVILATAAMAGPQTFCISGEAAFTDPTTGRLTVARRGPECRLLAF